MPELPRRGGPASVENKQGADDVQSVFDHHQPGPATVTKGKFRFMGQGKRRVRALLNQNPFCIFCGGDQPATTIDHQPARALFEDRQWPEGYEFPACDACNQSSRHYEHVWALLVRIGMGQPPVDFLKYAKSVGNNFPNLLRVLGTNETRRFFKEEGLKKAPGTVFSDLAMAEINASVSEEILGSVLKKILKALHYKHTGNIVPDTGEISVQWFTNANMHLLSDAHGEYRDILPLIPEVCRNGKDLSKQFGYRVGLNSTEGVSGYVIGFRQSIIAFGAVIENPLQPPLGESIESGTDHRAPT
jgi:hypothetical protein